PLERDVPDHGRIERDLWRLLQPAEILNPAEVLKVDLAVILTLPPTWLRMRAGIKEQTAGIAPQLGDRVKLEVNDLIKIFLFRKVAVHAMIFAPLWQAMTLRVQLLLVEINAGLFLFLVARCLVIPWRRLVDRECQSAAACDIHHRQGRNLQSALGAIGAALEEVTETESLVPALRNERGLLRRDPFRARVECGIHHPLRKVRPVKTAAELPRDSALGGVAGTTQIARVDTPTQGENRRNQSGKELPLRLTDRRQLLQDLVDNCHRP